MFDAFVTGPITPAALEHATITPSEGLMRIMGGGYARRFDVEVPIEYLRPYGALVFANVSDVTVDADAVPDSIEFQVYVNGQARSALVTSNFTVGPQTFALSQFFDRRPANVRIELPNAQVASDLPVPTANPAPHPLYKIHQYNFLWVPPLALFPQRPGSVPTPHPPPRLPPYHSGAFARPGTTLVVTLPPFPAPPPRLAAAGRCRWRSLPPSLGTVLT